MARSRKKSVSETGGTSTRFRSSFAKESSIRIPDADIAPHPEYRYTTPSFLGKRGAVERRQHGCIEEPQDRWCFKPKGKTASGKAKGDKCFHSEDEAIDAAGGIPVRFKEEKKFKGMRCLKKDKKGTCTDKAYDAFCAGSNSDPCGADRSTCPVQLVWVDGKPNLRFCKEKGKQGYMVPVRNVKEAMQISDKACADWPYKLGVVERADGSEGSGGWDPEFFDRNAPQIVAQARESYPKEGLGSSAESMGAAARRSMRDNSISGWPQAPSREATSAGGVSPGLWLAGGTIVGLLALRMLRKPPQST